MESFTMNSNNLYEIVDDAVRNQVRPKPLRAATSNEISEDTVVAAESDCPDNSNANSVTPKTGRMLCQFKCSSRIVSALAIVAVLAMAAIVGIISFKLPTASEPNIDTIFDLQRQLENVKQIVNHAITPGPGPEINNTSTEIFCSNLDALANGQVIFSSQSLTVGTTATYSCNTGYGLVGIATRICESTNQGTRGMWSGVSPVCQEVLCSNLDALANGHIVFSSQLLTVGTTATYSCNTGYGLVGTATRTCENTNQPTSIGMWSGVLPVCQAIRCPPIPAPENGVVTISTSSQLLSVGTTATYSCDPGHILVGDTIRTCSEDTSGGTLGKWTTITREPICALPSSASIDCRDTNCERKQFVCPEQDNCAIQCRGSSRYACFQTVLVCPRGAGNCNINCVDSYACLQTTVTCPGGNCTVNCDSSYSCLSVAINCVSDSCTVHGTAELSLRYSAISCPPNNKLCQIDCTGQAACQFLQLDCPSGGNCVFNFNGDYNRNHIGAASTITCLKNSMCSILCTGSGYRSSHQCSYSHITCPIESGDCTVECSSRDACQYSTIVCGRSSGCLSCSGRYSCNNATITLPNPSNDIASLECTGDTSCRYAKIACPENNCSIVCNNRDSCDTALLTCPTNSDCSISCNADNACHNATFNCSKNGNCAVSCSRPSACNYARFECLGNGECSMTCSGIGSCASTTITCPAEKNCTITCSGELSCHMLNVICSPGPGDYSCNILCTHPLACSELSITNTHNAHLQCCGGWTACSRGASFSRVVPSSTECQ